MVQVVNLENNEVIKEIPPEKILNVVAQIQNIIGLFVDTRR
jgi:flagellar protein FlaG